jgi:hypothetical protein
MELITTISEIQDYVAVAATSDINSLRPYIRLAERNYLEPVLGNAFLLKLGEIYTDSGKNVSAIADEKDKNVLSLVQEALANLAIMHALPILSVSIGASGIQVVSNDQMAPASQWRTNQVFESLAEVGSKTIDRLLTFLDAEKSKYALWAADPVYQSYQIYFIRSANEFNGLYNINDSRFLFHLICYCMQRVESFEIKKSIGSKLFDALKTQDKGGSLNGNFKVLLNDYLKPAISLFTIAKALQERLISISGGNVTIKFSGSTDNMNESRSPQLAELNQAIDSLRADASVWIADAQVFIADNPADFLPLETEASKRKRFNVKNDRAKGTYIF